MLTLSRKLLLLIVAVALSIGLTACPQREGNVVEPGAEESVGEGEEGMGEEGAGAGEEEEEGGTY